jgi:predicted nuclease with TOPRIM domain
VEKKIQALVEENRAVNDLLRERIAEVDKVNARAAEMEIELSKLRGMDAEMGLIKEVADLRHKEAEKYRIKCNQLEKELRDV